jgi:hypothetical protein
MTIAAVKEGSPDRNGIVYPRYIVNGWTPYKVIRCSDESVTLYVHGFALTFSMDDIEKAI